MGLIMANALTKKQQALFEQLDKETLLDIVQQIIATDAKTKRWLVDGWLSTPDEVIKRLNAAWSRQVKSSRYYDYYAADTFFTALIRNIAQPLAQQTAHAPAQVEALAAKILMDFERLTARVDTSSGSWQDFTAIVFATWIQALAAQKRRTPEDIAQAIFLVAGDSDWFDISELLKWRSALGSEALRILAQRFMLADNANNAMRLLLAVRDVDAALTLFSSVPTLNNDNALELARLLIDELRAPEAITLLRSLEKQIPAKSAWFVGWGEQMIAALLEEGQREQARDIALNGFSRSAKPTFWQLYLQAGGDEANDFPLFLNMASKNGNEEAIVFLEAVQNYGLLSDIITGQSPVGITICLPNDIVGSFWRTLSSTLFKHGYAQAAVVLRRRLAENAIDRATSQYYTYAASDAKKAIDYCAELESLTGFMNSRSWLQALYKAHSRKYSLWDSMQEKIAGLTVNKQGLYWQPVA